ncbi:hypothetical protein BAE47_18170 [Acidithiobacillus thiooxidans]|nr:hypothetical protein A6O26_18340 [Acidithiobacillus thiooxidans]OFC41342.1 hypothetical protein BAE47_18170 [Acidithiobacillus thiooxidans]
MCANSPLDLLTRFGTSLQDKAQDMVMFCRKKLFRKDVLGVLIELYCAVMGLVYSQFAAAQIIRWTWSHRSLAELCSKVVYGRVTTGLNEVAYCCYKGFPTQRAT